MKLVKSLLLGSAAGLAAVVSAQAADLPVKKAAPVEYVRVCSTYGAGFFYIPGTETCLRIGGRARADYLYGEPFDRRQDAIGFRARGRIQLDARTATAYGLLRTFVRFEITRSSGAPFGAVNAAGIGTISTSPDVAQAFVQFGGLTAGRVTSFFSNGDLPTDHMGTLRFDDAPDVNLLAYTFSFGNGFSATLSLEDGLDRRSNGFLVASTTALPVTYAGQRAPDVVANLKYDGTWGTAQLSGAVHQVRSDDLVFPFGAAFPTYPDTEYGFAISAQVGVNLPMIAEGDAAWIAATYTSGAFSYITGGSTDTLSAGVLSGILADAYINPVSGDLDLGKGWSVAGGFRHYWTPELRWNIFGSYARFDYSTGALASGLADFDETRIGTNLIWQPVSGLDIGAEVIYARLDPRGRVTLADGTSFGSDSAWEGRLRVQRDF
ncbi:porin [Microvirga subterranea]|uniref:Porin n=1 Tax=Microvirga subterranea TaxID=186651 RepID=A0A370HSL7_9HYPH|nr:porin [Microvirga subterranea]RDI60941.1 porin-like protein [Microvirga subterranea]